MIEIEAVIGMVVGALVGLLGKVVDKGAEKVGESTADSLIGSLKKKLGRDAAKTAVDEMAKAPTEPQAQAALKVELRKVLEAHPELAAELQRWVAEASSAAPTFKAIAKGDGNVIQQVHGSNNFVKGS